MSLVPYDVASQDKSVLFTESKNDDQSFRYIRRASVIAYHITANNHEIHDGRIVDLSAGTHISEWWKFTSYNKDQLGVTISCRSKEGYNLTIRDDTVMLAPADSKDKYQAGHISPSFVLLNFIININIFLPYILYVAINRRHGSKIFHTVTKSKMKTNDGPLHWLTKPQAKRSSMVLALDI